MVVLISNPPQTPPLVVPLPQQAELALLRIIRDNLRTQYATQAAPLAGFRDAIAAHGGPDVDATLLTDFRANVPLTEYDSYKPFIDKFDAKPCMEEDVKDMFSPGLPDFFGLSSATSGSKPKTIPRYNHDARLKLPARPFFDPNSKHPLAAVVCTAYREVKVIERAPGEVVQRIPVCIVSGGNLRRTLGCYTDDETSMSLSMSGYAVPWAATVITHFPSFLIIHGLFFLARPDVNHFIVSFATQFVDLVRHIDERWEVLVSCIRDGTIPDLKGIDHVREYLQAHLHPNPERASELIEIGRPFSCDGWFARVWPDVREITTICSGPFATVLPKVRSILGPDVAIRVPGYRSSECRIGLPHDTNKLDEFILRSEDVIELLDVSLEATHENLCQAWEVDVGKRYEPILTTRDGLWRYRLGDVLYIVGFDTTTKSPIFKYSGRRSTSIRLTRMQIIDDQLVAAIQAFSSEDTVLVQEFTTVVDDREILPAVGFFVELAGPLGPNAHVARQKLFEALVATNNEHTRALADERIGLPTIRIVKAGTFAEYRHWKGENADMASGQIKVPVILVNPIQKEWILERVVQEL